MTPHTLLLEEDRQRQRSQLRLRVRRGFLAWLGEIIDDGMPTLYTMDIGMEDIRLVPRSIDEYTCYIILCEIESIMEPIIYHEGDIVLFADF